MSDCERCDALSRTLEQMRESATVDLQNLQSDVIAKNREIGRLKNELAGVLDEDSPEAADVKHLLSLWHKTVKGGDKRVKADLKSTRAPKVRKALKRRGMEMCEKAILGVQFDDWAMGRISKSGGKDFNDIADHILVSDETIEKFARLYDKNQKPQLAVVPDPEPTRKRKFVDAPIDRVLGSLPGEWRTTPNPDEWVAQCPAHEDGRPSLVIRRNPDGMVWIKCWAGCEKERILDVLGLQWRDMWENSEDDHGAESWPYRVKGDVPAHLRDAMRQILAREERRAA
jgi:hypothetical protein